MTLGRSATLTLWLSGAVCLGSLACQDRQATTVTPSKIPITATSDEARQSYLQARDLFDKLRFADARTFYQRAVEQDPGFALAHLGLANTSPGFEEFFASLEQAVEAAGEQVSEGERHLVLAADAAANGDVEGQRRHLEALVALFPEDERAHTALGTFHFGRQEYREAIEHFDQANAIAPEYSPPYNQQGYAHRFLGAYDRAEAAFRKYIQLIPDEPNPYDSYAELLMRLGRYDESIQNYRKALEQDPNFVASYVGIGNNQMFLGQMDQARETFARLEQVARNDGERRQGLLWTASSWLHENQPKKALEVLERRSAIAEKNGDFAALAADAVLIGNLLLETGAPDPALERYRRAVELMDQSGATEEAKANFRRNQLYREARVAVAKGDLGTAKSKAQAYGEELTPLGIPFEIRQHHELLGIIAMQERDYAAAVEHLGQANQQNPRILFLTAQAYEGQGDAQRAREMYDEAANFNGLAFSYAYVRGPARAKLGSG